MMRMPKRVMRVMRIVKERISDQRSFAGAQDDGKGP